MRAAYPSRLCIFILASPCLLSLLLIFNSELLNGILLLDAIIVSLIIIDILSGRIRHNTIRVECELPRTWSLGRYEDIKINCEYYGMQKRLAVLTLDVPGSISCKPNLIEITLESQKLIEVSLQAKSNTRGRFQLGAVHIEIRSRLGLWKLHYLLGNNQDIFVYPNIKQLHDYALLARTNRLALIGVRKMRTVGGDTEFERLRDYHSDDPIQRIDWKASARRDELIVRDYQPNQSQSIMLMVDAGRMMVTKTEGADKDIVHSMLDHAINAALLLAYVAIKQGDRVGLICYADGIKRYIPAAGGEKQIHTLIHAVHDVHAELVESRHEDAFLYLQKMERKRSLVVMFSHVLDDVNRMHIEQHCKKLVGRHLPMAVLLRDQNLHAHLERAPRSSEELWEADAAAHICNWRQELIDTLRSNGCLVLDSDPDELNAGVITQYLDLKAKHLI